MNDAQRKVYEAMSHAALYQMRGQPGVDQNALAPIEHQAFAREFAQESPLQAAVSLPFAIPLYSAAKAVGLQNARSPASINEVASGYKGLMQGLLPRFFPVAKK